MAGHKKKKRPTHASLADRHDLYQQSVQCVEAEIDFVDDTYKQLRGRRAVTLREDFCGTANTSCEWVRRRRTNKAIGVDLDDEVLDWGRENNAVELGKDVKRLDLHNKDVMSSGLPQTDIVLAMNFSYWIFKERAALKRYFCQVRKGLTDKGVFFLDAYGGHDSFKIMRERTEFDDFTYIWDQASYNPISGDMTCHIHFRFPDGSRLKEAFTYEWRLWTLPEIRELLAEAGFTNVTVFWQGTEEETGEADGIFSPATDAEPDPAWIAYIAAEV
jgi:hypothetical protein